MRSLLVILILSCGSTDQPPKEHDKCSCVHEEGDEWVNTDIAGHTQVLLRCSEPPCPRDTICLGGCQWLNPRGGVL